MPEPMIPLPSPPVHSALCGAAAVTISAVLPEHAHTVSILDISTHIMDFLARFGGAVLVVNGLYAAWHEKRRKRAKKV